MATIQNVNLANTFGEWINVTNATVNEVNSLTACNYTKSTGTLYLNDPTLGLSVLANTYLTGNVEVSATGTLIVRKNIEVQNTIFLTNKTTGSKSNNVVLEANGVANISYVNITGTGAAANVTNNFRVGGTSTFVGAVSGTSGSFTGVVTVPTAATGTSNTMIATTAYVQTTNTSMKTYVDSQDSTLTSYINSINNSYLPLKANTASPTFTGAPLAPTAASGTSNTMIATTAFVATANTNMKSLVDLKAPLDSPALTNTPTSPTAATGTSNTMIATTAFVQTANTNMKSLVDLKAPLLSPSLSYVSLAAGSSTAGQSPLKYTSGTLLGTAEVGATEFDGTNFYQTAETTSGRGVVPINQQFILSSAGSAFGATVGNFFGSSSAINLLSGTTYQIQAYCLFLKTSAGTLTWAPTFSSAPASCHAFLEYTPITGFTTSVITGAMLTSEATALNAATMTFGATGSLTTGVYHVHKFKIFVTTNAATNMRLNVTQSAGTLTPQAGSWYTVRRLTTTSGSFAA